MRIILVLILLALAGCLDGADTKKAPERPPEEGGEALRHIDFGSLRTFRHGAETCTGLEVSPGVSLRQGGVAREVYLEPGDTRVVFHFDWVGAGLFAPESLVVYIVDGGPLTGKVVTSATMRAGETWEIPVDGLPGTLTMVVAGSRCEGEGMPHVDEYDLWPQMRAEIYHQYPDLAVAPGLEALQQGPGADATATFVRTGATVCSIMGEEDVGPSTSTPVQIETRPGDILLEGMASWDSDAVLRIEFVVDGTLWFSATGPSPLPYGRLLVGDATVADGEVRAPTCGAAISVQPAVYDVEVDLVTRLSAPA